MTKQKDDFFHFYTLSNGIRLVHKPVSSLIAYTGLMVGAGTRDEQPDENGMAHFIEHTVFKGSATRSARQIINRMEDVGGEINAYTTKEETAFYAATLPQYVGRTMELLADIIFSPAFPKHELDMERRVIYDEIESYNDSPSELIYDDFESLIFNGYSIARPVLGTRRTLRYFTADKARRFLQETYAPDRMVIFVMANLPFTKVKTLAERYFTDVPYLSAHARTRETPTVYQPENASFHRHTHQTHVMLGSRAYPIGHERQLALYLINNILGGGAINSRLNLSLREQKGLVYTVESQYTPLSDTGYWSVYFASEPDNRELCIDLVLRELQRLRETPLSPSALNRALRQLRGQMAVSAENQENAALTMAKQTLYCGQPVSWQQSLQKMQTFTPEFLQQTAEEVFRPDQIALLQYV